MSVQDSTKALPVMSWTQWAVQLFTSNLFGKHNTKKNSSCFPVKKLPLSLVQYILTFNTPKEHASCRRTCQQLKQSLLLGVNLHKFYTLQDHAVPLDLCMREAMNRILGKERDAQTQSIKGFRFPEGSIIALKSGKSVDVSGIHFDLSDIFIGGIGYGGGGSKLPARTMDAIGHNDTVYNLPVCIEDCYDGGFQVISTLDRAIPLQP